MVTFVGSDCHSGPSGVFDVSVTRRIISWTARCQVGTGNRPCRTTSASNREDPVEPAKGFLSCTDNSSSIFVAIPKIAQSRVNAATLTIQGITLSQTQATNFTLAINSTIEADDSIHAVIDPFEGVMYLEDWAPQTPFARINFPSVTSAAKSAVNITQFTQILDLNAFTVFNTWFIQNETIRVSVEGDSHLAVSGVNRKYPVHFKKTIEFPALANFNGTTVPNSTVLLTPNAQGDNFVGTAIIPNRSFINFEIVSLAVLLVSTKFVSEREVEGRGGGGLKEANSLANIN